MEVFGLSFEVSGLGFKVLGLGFEVLGLGFEVWGLCFQVFGLGFEVLSHSASWSVLGFGVLLLFGSRLRGFGSMLRGFGLGFEVLSHSVSWSMLGSGVLMLFGREAAVNTGGGSIKTAKPNHQKMCTRLGFDKTKLPLEASKPGSRL